MASTHSVNDPEHCLRRAEEMRTLAESMKDDVAKQTMLRIAADYERLAKRAEERAKGTRPS
jgi:molecular chaperone GrpE (heat shock protein)